MKQSEMIKLLKKSGFVLKREGKEHAHILESAKRAGSPNTTE